MQFIAVDKMAKEVSEDELNRHLPSELAATVGLYLNEVIRTFYFRLDRPGVVFILEANSLEEVKVELSKLPLVEVGILEFEIIPIGPLTPLGKLFNPTV
ncbi:MAG: hypothetical protein HEP71_21015 [Roseivirga sp.]|nr:hypothetical protein [Roseivirga sp.]